MAITFGLVSLGFILCWNGSIFVWTSFLGYVPYCGVLTFLLGSAFLESLLHSKFFSEASPLPRLEPQSHLALHVSALGFQTSAGDLYSVMEFHLSPTVQPGLSQSPTASRMQTSWYCSPGNSPFSDTLTTNPNLSKSLNFSLFLLRAERAPPG